MKKEIKLAFVMEDYKLKNKETVIQQALTKKPEINKHYKFIKEELVAGPMKGCTSVFRYYELKNVL